MNRMKKVEDVLSWAFQHGMVTAAPAAIEYCAATKCAVRIEDLGQYPEVFKFFDDEAAAVAGTKPNSAGYSGFSGLPGYEPIDARPNWIVMVDGKQAGTYVGADIDEAIANAQKAGHAGKRWSAAPIGRTWSETTAEAGARADAPQA